MLLTGCFFYPDSSERANDNIVFTSGKPEADFGKYKTFAIDPEIVLVDIQSDGSAERGKVDEELAKDVMDRVVRNLEDRGFSRVEMDSDPDLGVSAAAISGYAVGSVSGGYWGGYYGGYWGYPGWTYFYPYEYYYAYHPGTLVLELVDLKAARESYPAGDDGDSDAGPGPGGLPVVWTMGAYQAYADNKSEAATTAIDQAFDQSPYLRSN